MLSDDGQKSGNP